MTLAQMVTMVQLRIRDPQASYFSAVQIRTALNMAVRRVGRMVGRLQRLNYTTGTESFTTTGNTTAYALSATDIRRVWRMRRTDSTPDQECEEIADLDQLDIHTNYWDGKWRFYTSRNATTKAFSINFPHYAIAAGMTFLVEYLARVPELATDGTADSSSYTQIDEDQHELVVQEAVVDLLAPDSSLYQPAAIKLADLREETRMELQSRVTPDEIQQDFFR